MNKFMQNLSPGFNFTIPRLAMENTLRLTGSLFTAIIEEFSDENGFNFKLFEEWVIFGCRCYPPIIEISIPCLSAYLLIGNSMWYQDYPTSIRLSKVVTNFMIELDDMGISLTKETFRAIDEAVSYIPNIADDFNKNAHLIFNRN